MKRLLTATLALSLLAGTAATASAQPRHDDRRDNDRYEQSRHRDNDRYEQNRRHDNGNHYGQQKKKHRWAKGERLDRSYYADRSRYVDYRRHQLRAPPRGYQWVQVDNNYAMVALTTGLIASIIAAN
jgi:Ni/Co efflux regulator RcnB